MRKRSSKWLLKYHRSDGIREPNFIHGNSSKEIYPDLLNKRNLSVNTREACCHASDIKVVVHDGQGYSKKIEVDVSTTAADLCRTFDRCVDLRFWQLHEELPDLPGFGHPIEDHELIICVVRKCLVAVWPFEEYEPRFCLIENPNKYKLHMVFNMVDQRYFNCCALNHLSNLRVEEVNLLYRCSHTGIASEIKHHIPPYVTSGFIWFRSPQWTWRKMFCFLHGSSVFYSISNRRVSASCMRILVDLSTVDVFQPIYPLKRAPFKAPTSHIIVCRPQISQPLNYKCMLIFACRTAEGRAGWINGFRVHKFGLGRLEANLRKVVLLEHLVRRNVKALRKRGKSKQPIDELRTRV
ncbi:unnamed protein product [Dicrocoelium dendriticum]|nr:unnamed protein product [Dicrocoelium dendriticum]